MKIITTTVMTIHAFIPHPSKSRWITSSNHVSYCI